MRKFLVSYCKNLKILTPKNIAFVRKGNEMKILKNKDAVDFYVPPKSYCEVLLSHKTYLEDTSSCVVNILRRSSLVKGQ